MELCWTVIYRILLCYDIPLRSVPDTDNDKVSFLQHRTTQHLGGMIDARNHRPCVPSLLLVFLSESINQFSPDQPSSPSYDTRWHHHSTTASQTRNHEPRLHRRSLITNSLPKPTDQICLNQPSSLPPSLPPNIGFPIFFAELSAVLCPVCLPCFFMLAFMYGKVNPLVIYW
ncbi:hypothetical protein L873DRAFT_820435 [Choiromyces venosus 120613-1]|uniref:Uncharacterized protein n=1 Tax=Choiromyces venosus 120613-1 TaxID=1336337 RepID=A0A3N4IU05_9PEZI|nr:hypothetical protein L873DRAFT_820435 [Choiromyces venosus 120613-1]